ncbi:hypothetical protein [Streptomyces sp. NPDC097610]|uniref:hypothetical protein n=1 Tax=Streptomyces sp. NPDC097610 TaxID=3157227 RepID=UPI00331704A3
MTYVIAESCVDVQDRASTRQGEPLVVSMAITVWSVSCHAEFAQEGRHRLQRS